MSSFIQILLPCFVLFMAEFAWSEPQLIALRHPESSRDQNQASRLGAAGRRSRFTAKPGNVIVHFDKQHEIQQLKYVLQDGRLVTLYQRHSNHPSNVQTPIHVQVPNQASIQQETGSGKQPVEQPSQQRQLTSQPSLPILASVPNQTNNRDIDHDQTIDILDSKLQGVSQLVGDHITIALPGGINHQGESTIVGSSKNSNEDDDGDLEVLATVAKDALQAGAQLSESKLRKAGVMLGSLRKKVTQKLRDLPNIIGENLRSKSSAGQVFLDRAGQKIEILPNGTNQTSLLKPQMLPVSNPNSQPIVQRIAPQQPISQQQIQQNQVTNQQQQPIEVPKQTLLLSPQYLINKKK